MGKGGNLTKVCVEAEPWSASLIVVKAQLNTKEHSHHFTMAANELDEGFSAGAN